MRSRAARAFAISCALFSAPGLAAAQAAPAAKPPATARPYPMVQILMIEDLLADTASGLCVDVLSGTAKLPAPGTAEWWRGYKLTEGMSTTALDALGPKGTGLISQASLAHGTATDGDFVVALGGSAGETCRLIVYRAISADRLAARTSAAMASPSRKWKPLPTPSQYAAAGKSSFVLRRDGKPYLANLLTPTTPGPIAAVIVVAAVPPQVTLPPGF